MSHFKFSKLAVAVAGAAVMLSSNAYSQQVALLDSGVDPDRGFNVVSGFNYITNTDNTDDVSERDGEGHGTISVRLVSESFSGEIVPFVVTDGSLDRSNEAAVRRARDSALSDVLGRDSVRVVGITWGTSGVSGSAAPLVSDLSGANKVVAIMAGNDVSDQPSPLASASFNLSGVIIVGATDGAGTLLAESNRAGNAADKYVAAIGLPNPDSTSGGSSWAAARIAGIAGGVLQQNPDLTAAQVVDVILRSAEDRGATGTDAEYGRGFIRNAQQVLNNVIGTPTVPTPPPDGGGGGGGGGGAGAALLVGGAVAGALLLLRKPKSKLEKTLVLDSYGRTFQTDLGAQIAVNDDALHLDQFFHSLDQKMVSNAFALPELKTEVAFAAVTQADPRFDFVEYFAAPDDVVAQSEDVDFSLAIASQLSETVDLSAGYRVSPDQEFGASRYLESNADFGSSSFISGQSFSSVLSGFSNQAQTASLSYSPKKNKRVSAKLGLVSVNESRDFGQDSFSTLLEGGYQFTDNAGLSVQFGQIEENGSLFGGAAGGLFGVETASTYAINVSGHIKASQRFSIVANYGIGRTSVDAGENSLLNDFSTLRSDWYSLGVIGNNVLRDSDQFGVAFSQPLKIRSGAVDYSIPTGRNLQTPSLINFDTERVNLGETNATENRLEGYYRTMLSDNIELGGFLSYRKNPNHVSDEGDEALGMMTVRLAL